MLHFQPANPDQPLEKLPMAQKLHAVAAISLVLAPEPKQVYDFLSAKAPLGQLVSKSGVYLHAHCHIALFFSLDLLIHNSRPLYKGAKVICPVREYFLGQADISAKQRNRPEY